MNSTDHQDIYGISGSTGSKELLETRKYFADASSILAFFLSVNAIFLLHACQQM